MRKAELRESVNDSPLHVIEVRNSRNAINWYLLAASLTMPDPGERTPHRPRLAAAAALPGRATVARPARPVDQLRGDTGHARRWRTILSNSVSVTCVLDHSSDFKLELFDVLGGQVEDVAGFGDCGRGTRGVVNRAGE